MIKLFLSLSALASSFNVYALNAPSYIYAHRNCDIIIESTSKALKVSKILQEKGFIPVKENTAQAQAAEFAYNALVDRNGPFPISVRVTVLRRLGDIEYVYVNGDDVNFPHLEARSVIKIHSMTRAIGPCRLHSR